MDMFGQSLLTPGSAFPFGTTFAPLGEAAQSAFLSASANSILDLTKPSSPPMSDSAPLHFTAANKMSLFSLEKRIDYHLSRIMKGHRLINFKNSIERLPTEKRICECILEVLMSSINLIVRKTKIISESKTMVEFLNEMSAQQKGNGKEFDSAEYSHLFVLKLGEVKQLAIGLEQIIWALNSNKEHIKYIVKVFTVPDQYQRSEFAMDSSSIVPLRQSITHTIDQCEEVITVCRLLRGKLANALIKWFIAHC